MPLEVPFGYPDYMRRSVITDQLLVNDTVSGVSGQQYGVFYVANIPALLVNLVNGIHPVQVEFRWCADRLANQVIRATHVDVPTGLEMVHTVVPQAPYLVIATNMDAGGDPLNYSLQVTIVPDMRYPTTDIKWTNLLTRTGIAIGAGATITERAQVVRCGEVDWQANITGGSFQVTMLREDINGAAVPIGKTTDTASWYSTMKAYWGGGGLRVDLHNISGAPQTYDLLVTANPTLAA